MCIDRGASYCNNGTHTVTVHRCIKLTCCTPYICTMLYVKYISITIRVLQVVNAQLMLGDGSNIELIKELLQKEYTSQDIDLIPGHSYLECKRFHCFVIINLCKLYKV